MTAKNTTFKKFLKVFSFFVRRPNTKERPKAEANGLAKHRILLKTSPVSEGEVEQHHGTGNRSILE